MVENKMWLNILLLGFLLLFYSLGVYLGLKMTKGNINSFSSLFIIILPA